MSIHFKRKEIRMKEIYKDKFGNLKNRNPFKKPKRKNFPNFKTYIRFGMHKKFNERYITTDYWKEMISELEKRRDK